MRGILNSAEVGGLESEPRRCYRRRPVADYTPETARLSHEHIPGSDRPTVRPARGQEAAMAKESLENG